MLAHPGLALGSLAVGWVRALGRAPERGTQ